MTLLLFTLKFYDFYATFYDHVLNYMPVERKFSSAAGKFFFKIINKYYFDRTRMTIIPKKIIYDEGSQNLSLFMPTP